MSRSPQRSAPTDRPGRRATDVVGGRIGAQIIDVIAMTVQLVAVATLLGGGRGGFFLGLLTLPLYGGLLEGYWNGQTLGKKALGIKVVDARGGKVTVGQAAIRNLPAVIMPGWLVYLVALASMAMTDTRQRVFDQIAGTVVIRA